MSIHLGKIGDHAAEIVGIPDWHWFELKCLPERAKDVQVVKIRGAVAPLKSPLLGSKGRDWKKKDRATVREIYITPREHEAWLREWEKRTGQCAKCDGSGQELAGWSDAEGTRTRTCSDCRGDGRAHRVSEAEA